MMETLIAHGEGREIMNITLRDFFIQQGWANGYAEVRRYLDSGKVFVNGYGVTSVDEKIKLHEGDSVKFGKHKKAIYNA